MYQDAGGPTPHTAMLTHTRTHGTYMVDQGPGHTPGTHATTHSTNARMEHTGWTRNLPRHTWHRLPTNARVAPAVCARSLVAPPTHTTAQSQTHAWSIPGEQGTWSQLRHTPPLTHKRTHRVYKMDQEPGRTPHTHTTAFSQTHACNIRTGPGTWPHPTHTPPLTRKRTCGT